MPTLYVVATPIGNLSDASPRMLKTLAEVSLIAAEDTRVTGKLLRHFQIATPMTSLHRHNEAGKAGSIVARMVQEDISVALVTDAGTPAISDPGFLFVQEAAEQGIEILAIPGPTALASALSVSGFDAREFAFYGFLPRSRGDLVKKLIEIARSPIRVAVLHESPHRVVSLMEAVSDTLPGCKACVCCDLTKLYEKSIRDEAGAALAALRANPNANKGEYCVVLDLHNVMLPDVPPDAQASLEARVFEMLLEGKTAQEAIDALVSAGVRKNEAKRAALRVREFLSA